MNNDLVFKVIKRTVIVSLFILGFSAFIFKEPKPIIYGFLFGMIISILGFKLLHTTINRAVEMTPRRASAYSSMHYFFRYIIYFVVLAVAALADYLDFLATVVGLLIVKFVIIGSAIFNKNFKANKDSNSN